MDDLGLVTWDDAREGRESLPFPYHLDRRQTVGFLVHHDETILVLAHDRNDDDSDVYFSVIPHCTVHHVARLRPDEPVVSISTG
jgi:hypothetical protein